MHIYIESMHHKMYCPYKKILERDKKITHSTYHNSLCLSSFRLSIACLLLTDFCRLDICWQMLRWDIFEGISRGISRTRCEFFALCIACPWPLEHGKVSRMSAVVFTASAVVNPGGNRPHSWVTLEWPLRSNHNFAIRLLRGRTPCSDFVLTREKEWLANHALVI